MTTLLPHSSSCPLLHTLYYFVFTLWFPWKRYIQFGCTIGLHLLLLVSICRSGTFFLRFFTLVFWCLFFNGNYAVATSALGHTIQRVWVFHRTPCAVVLCDLVLWPNLEVEFRILVDIVRLPPLCCTALLLAQRGKRTASSLDIVLSLIFCVFEQHPNPW